MMTREQRILRIVSTLRPTDPGSWGPNTHYVTMEFNEHDAEQRAEIARLREALQFYADPQSYGIHGGSSARIMADAGQTAKHALAKEHA